MSEELGDITLAITTMKYTPINIAELELNHANENTENTEYFEKKDSWFIRLLTWIGTYICWRDR